ncbi:hypothetical protein GX645_02460 [Candidatus Sumerlaeota bacterium]|nr:hypothetical protein [Candidatus Sumerlaeales bacterium]NLD61296.1 hypothetical protein [Candidatus Sumerlaeota bacterium]
MKTPLTDIRMTGRRGLTLTELVTVMAILTFITTLIVMVYNSQMKEARVTIAQAECKMLGQAEEVVAMEFGFFVPLQILNDRPITHNGTYAGRGNQINLETDNMYVINAHTNLEGQFDNQSRLGGVSVYGTGESTNADARVTRMIRQWKGPYATFQRWYIPPTYSGPTDSSYLNSDTDRRRDFPLDPWGNPYFLYSPYGPTGYYPMSQTVSSNIMENNTFSNGQLRRDGNYRTNPQFAVVSWGPDGIMNEYQNDDYMKDDIFYFFGTLHD